MTAGWEARYQRGETGWDRGGFSPALELMVAQLPPAASVLIPGCGRGHEVLELARRGFRVTAIDIAPSAIAHVRASLNAEQLDAVLIQGDLFTYKATEPFDAIYEQTCLCAIQPEQRADYERCLYRWLKAQGLLYAMLMQTGVAGGPPFHCDALAMRSLFDADRWQWPDTVPAMIPHRNGRFELGYSLIRR